MGYAVHAGPMPKSDPSIHQSIADFPKLTATEQQAVLLQCLKMQEQYKRSRTVLLQELSQQGLELERLQSSVKILNSSVQVRVCYVRAWAWSLNRLA
jgi:hypothetical protein